MLPTREEAIALVRDGLACNPGQLGKTLPDSSALCREDCQCMWRYGF